MSRVASTNKSHPAPARRPEEIPAIKSQLQRDVSTKVPLRILTLGLSYYTPLALIVTTARFSLAERTHSMQCYSNENVFVALTALTTYFLLTFKRLLDASLRLKQS